MLYEAPRTCSDGISKESKPIEEFRNLDAYVLLGDAGAGKTTLFKKEAEESNGEYITARDFLTFADNRPKWREKTLFIDGLDETRTKIDAIRSSLDKLDSPRFRLSCRAADWLGNNDKDALAKCSRSHKITVLYLNDLSNADTQEILRNHNIDADKFMSNAHQYNLDGLLVNPQTLNMLIAAVEENKWPTTKLETYKLATEKLVQDPNEEHNNKNSDSSLLEAAGFLCALQLLADTSGFNFKDENKKDQIYLKSLKKNDLPYLDALKTNLFKKDGEIFIPVHRSIAEYLAAEYLAKKIKEGLPVGRVLALITGIDGGVVSSLRGLSAWLSVCSFAARDRLVDVDPLGVILYGDVKNFSPESKKKLLIALQKKPEESQFAFFDYYSSDYGFSALTTKDIKSELQQILRKKTVTPCLNYILMGLSNSESIPELKDDLLTIIYDNTYSYGVRTLALEAFIHQQAKDIESLLVLAKDLKNNEIGDNKGLLRSQLLSTLFPVYINADDILDYCDFTVNDAYRSYHFLQKVKDSDVPVLLEEFSLKKIDFHEKFHLLNMIGNLLRRGLDFRGDQIEPDRLYDWLSLGIDKYSHSQLSGNFKNDIRAWIECKPERYFKIFGEGLRRLTYVEKKGKHFYIAKMRLYNAKEPESICQWWLAKILDISEQEIKEAYFEQAFYAAHDNNHILKNWINTHPRFAEQYKKMCEWKNKTLHQHAQCEKELSDKQIKRLETSKQKEVKEYNFFKERQSSIEAGSAEPRIFYHLANMYIEQANLSGQERLLAYLNKDAELVAATMTGLRKIIDRNDLPKISDIFEFFAKGTPYLICLAFIISLNLRYSEDPTILDTLSDEIIQKALAFWFTYTCGTDNEPAWVKPLSLARPELTTQVMLEYVSTMWGAKVSFIYGLYQLAYDADYAPIAKLVVLPLLRNYSVRNTEDQLSNLNYLLEAAIKYIEQTELLQLVKEKLAFKSMNVSQRVYWLATGLILKPSTYESKIREYVDNKIECINHLIKFVNTKTLELSSMAIIIELLAPHLSATSIMSETDYVNGLINQLAQNSQEESQKLLSHLLSLPQLESWHEQFRTALVKQKVNQRESEFTYPSVNAVEQMLNNLKPVNVKDLSAITLHLLEDLSIEMHSSDTDNYQQFWNEAKTKKKELVSPSSPRTETACCNYLISRLKPHLNKLQVEVFPESHEANDKRADIKLVFMSEGNSYRLPIEVKCNSNKKLWTAIHKQLIPSYTSAPETQGRGIYLVLWFGEKGMPNPPSGKKPKNAAELKDRLKQLLSPQEKIDIDIFVLDVSSGAKKDAN